MTFSGLVTGLVLLSGLAAIRASFGASLYIFNGRPALRGQFPYQVAITFNNGTATGYDCGGSILNGRWILTAAHCIRGNPFWDNINHIKMRVGTVDWTKGRHYDVQKFIVHEDFTTDQRDYDIALIKTTKTINFNNFVKTIAISSSAVDGGHNVTVSGWGRINDNLDTTKIMQYAKVKTISNEDCKKYHNDLAEALTGNMLCTISTNDITACHGDSGGPLAMRGQLVGITSFVLNTDGKKCNPNYPNVFVRVSSFTDWIDRKMKEN